MSHWLLLLLALALASCNLVAQPEQGQPPAGQGDNGGATETYTNTTAGYAVDFPSGWHLVADDPGFVQLWSIDPASLPEDGQGDFVVIGFLVEDDEAISLDALAQSYEEAITAGGAAITSSRPIQLESGLRAVEIETSDGAFVVLTLVNGRGLHVDGFGSTDLFYSVVDTLREVSIDASGAPTI